MSSLVNKQSEFSQNVAKLLQYANEVGYNVTFGECYRPTLLQRLYIKMGKSWTLKGQHLKRLAIDLNLFYKGIYLSKTRNYKKLGIYWETLSPYNVWGGRFRDGNHFEMRHDKKRKYLRGGKYADDLSIY